MIPCLTHRSDASRIAGVVPCAGELDLRASSQLHKTVVFRCSCVSVAPECWCPLQEREVVSRTGTGRFELPAIAELTTLSHRSSDGGDTLLAAGPQSGLQSRAISGAAALASGLHPAAEFCPQEATSLTDEPPGPLIERESSLADGDEGAHAVRSNWSDASTLALRRTDSDRRDVERGLEEDLDRGPGTDPGGGSPDYTALLGGWRPAVSPHGGALELTMQNALPTAADVAAATAAVTPRLSLSATAPWALSRTTSHVSFPLSARTAGSARSVELNSGGPRHVFLGPGEFQGDALAVAEGVTPAISDIASHARVPRGELVDDPAATPVATDGAAVEAGLEDGGKQHGVPRPLQLEPSRPGRAYRDRGRQPSGDVARRRRERQGSTRQT